MKKILTLIILLLIIPNLFANNSMGKDELPIKINYSLPHTVLDFKINLERRVYQKGIFSQFSMKYLGLSPENMITEDHEDWSLINVDMDSHKEIDPSALYSVEIKGEYEALKLNLSVEGYIAGYNSNYESKIEDTKAAFFSLSPAKPVSPLLEKFCLDVPFKIAKDTIVSVLEMAGDEQEHLKIKGKRKLKSLEQKAADAAHEIFKLRKRRFKILTSNYEKLPADAASYQIVIEELKKLEEQYLELFFGKTSVFTETRTFSLIPSLGKESEVIARYSKTEGFVDSKDLSGLPIIVEFNNVIVDKDVNVNTNSKNNKDNFIFYRVPARVDVSIYEAKTLLGTKNMIIPQLGKLSNLSLNLLIDQKLAVEYYPEFGSLKRIFRIQAATGKN